MRVIGSQSPLWKRFWYGNGKYVVVGGGIVGLLAWSYFRDPFAHWDNEPQAGSYVRVTEKVAKTPSEETHENPTTTERTEPERPKNEFGDDVESVEAGFDPDDPRTLPEYSLPVELTDAKYRELMARMDELKELTEEFHRHENAVFQWMRVLGSQDIKDRLYLRIKTGQGFKYPEVSKRWVELTEYTLFPDLGAFAATLAFNTQLEGMKSDVLAHRVTVGQVKWLEYGIRIYKDSAERSKTMLRHTQQLAQWLKAENIIETALSPDEQALDWRMKNLRQDDDAWRHIREDVLGNNHGNNAQPETVGPPKMVTDPKLHDSLMKVFRDQAAQQPATNPAPKP